MHSSKFYPWPPNVQEGDPSHPCIVGTLSTAQGFHSIQTAVPDTCDVVELRYDLPGLSASSAMELARTILNQNKGVIFTCRLELEGGKWPEDSPKRFDLLTEALALGAVVDIEAASKFSDSLIEMAEAQNKWVVLSAHDFQKTPNLNVLRDRCRMQDTRSCIIHKVATQLQCTADIDTLRALITESPDLAVCAMGMGPLGPQSRIELAEAGSCLTYGYLDRPAAPGQLSCLELRAAFEASSS